ncbi:hypothetical protein MB02_09935 [Croceicoccus estronivorus]|uniref:FAS1-like dehydratase domain-containing protein n=1 Tax=Croceicoccus estronivorus TaxID=1172626 RepID=UPI000830E81D|nr:MaoC family dehydratase N-terminal domain-containing protein [Croceicoccus estronivorus]OCC23502.1 hypothetical protein MB02_09935 [Croceicoccus estronivorus]
MTLSQSDIDHWREWVGNTETVTERIEPVLLDRYAAALGEDRTAAHLPSLAHWAFFIQAVPPSQIGPDGHPRRGGFLPPVTLERRMFAASDIVFHHALHEGSDATRHAQVASLTHKAGKSGDLILVEVSHRIEQGGQTCIEERQTIVYRDGGKTAAVEDTALPAAENCEIWQPGAVDLFRFSSVTFNSHRIHYDLPYATGEEHYPGLVVHGPFTAAKLFGLAQRLHGPISRFSFRALAPLFAGQPIVIGPGDEPGQVIARRCDGVAAMVANLET